MARVRNIPSTELPPDLAAIYERFAGTYGPFRNQAAVFAHVPVALRHLMSMLLELREAATPRYPELDERDKLVVAYAIAAWERPNRIPDALFARLEAHFSEAQLVELTLRITLCGFFNKFNDALGIEEEPEAVERLAAISASAE